MKKTRIILLFIAFVAGISAAFLFGDELDEYRQEITTKIPQSYSDCENTKYADYNEFGCSVTYYGELVNKKCESKGGCILDYSTIADKSLGIHLVDNDYKSCLITFYNPDFSYPKDISECVALRGEKYEGYPRVDYNPNKKYCEVSILKQCNGEKEVVDKLIDSCPKDYTKNNTSCSKNFPFIEKK